MSVGYNDGSVSFWSKTNKFSFLRRHKDLHNDPIVDIKFGRDGDVLYVADEKGVVTGISVKEALGFINVKELPIHNCDDMISSLVISKSKACEFQVGFIMFDNYYLSFNPSLDGNFNFKKSNKFDDKVKIELYPYDNLYLMTIIHGSKFEIRQVKKDGDSVSILEETDTECGEIISLIHLSKSLIFYLTTEGYACLINSYGKTLLKNNSNNLLEFKTPNFLCYNNDVILTSNTVEVIKFLPWDKIIKKIADNGYQIQSLNYLAEIYLGLNNGFISIPTNPSLRKKKVVILAKQIYLEFFKNVVNDKDKILENIEDVIYSVISLHLCNFFVDEIYKIFEDNSRSDEFCDALFRSSGKDFIKFYDEKFFDKFLNYCEKQNKLNEVENVLLGYNYSKNIGLKILPVIVRYDLFRLVNAFYPKDVSDYILLCQIYYENGKILNFIHEILSKTDDNEIGFKVKTILVWIMIPDDNGKYKRLKDIFSKDWNLGLDVLKQIKDYFPIKFSKTEKLKIENVVEAILQILDSETYIIAKPYLDFLLPIFQNIKLSHFSLFSLKHIFTWVFNSEAPNQIRSSVLKILIQKYPNIISKDYLIQLCENECFIDFILDCYLPQKSYDKIISAMLNYEGYRATIFDFIEERINGAYEQIFIAILANVSVLLLLDPEKLVSIIQKYYSTNHFKIVEILPPRQKLIYLITLLETVGQSDFEPKWILLIFQLLVQYSPQSAYTFLSKHMDEINIDEAEKIAIKANRVDCEVQIKIFKHKYSESVERIGNQIEEVLLELIESNTRVSVTSIDELPDIKELKKPMDVIASSIELLGCITTGKAISWQKVFLKFQFPLYHAMQKSKTEKSNIFNTIELLFCYFVISSLNYISIQHLLAILSVHFSVSITQKDYLYILQTIVNRMNYQKDI